MEKPGSATWPWAEWEAFDALTSVKAIGEADLGTSFPFNAPQSFPALVLTGLLGTGSVPPSNFAKSPTELREQRLLDLWSKVKAHPTYVRLHADRNFLAAQRVFKKRQHNDAATGRGYGDKYAELRFLNAVAHVVTLHANYPHVKHRSPTLETRRDALDAAQKLLAAIDEGMRLDKYSDDLAH